MLTGYFYFIEVNAFVMIFESFNPKHNSVIMNNIAVKAYGNWYLKRSETLGTKTPPIIRNGRV